MGFCGRDEAADSLKILLENAEINCQLEQLDDYPTVTKLRVMSRHQQLIRLDFEDGFHQVDPANLLQHFIEQLDQAKVVVLSDYGKGTLDAVEKFIGLARSVNKPVLVDPKGNNFNIYRHATVITPNLSEFEAVVGSCRNREHLVEKGMNLLNGRELTAWLVTRGEHGMTLLSKGHEPLHLPTHAREVYDVTGAGDTVISVLAAALAAADLLVGRAGSSTLAEAAASGLPMI